MAERSNSSQGAGTKGEQQISFGLRLTFLLHFIIAGLVGLQHLVAPRVWTDLAGVETTATVTWRVIGAALIAFAVSSWLAFRDRFWERVRIIVVMEVVWSVLGAVMLLWGVFVEGMAPLELLNVFILAGFAVSFTYHLLRGRAVQRTAWPTEV